LYDYFYMQYCGPRTICPQTWSRSKKICGNYLLIKSYPW
jgi:hypothetical protein